MTSNKNAHNFKRHFGAQFFMLYHLVGFILFRVLGQETTLLLVEILEQPIRNFHFMVFRANTRNKRDHSMWKSMKNWSQKWCQSLCALLFVATFAFGKMWHKIETIELAFEHLRRMSTIFRPVCFLGRSYGGPLHTASQDHDPSRFPPARSDWWKVPPAELDPDPWKDAGPLLRNYPSLDSHPMPLSL